MDLFYLILAVLLLAAIADLVVGVANDAVNFLNSAIGSKVAPRTVIMVIASLGILTGVTFSSGMMEIARKGIFNPEMLTFVDVMFIFSATMLTDVLLLDFFNTFGLPTSTTVSLVFELLGAAFAISLIKVLTTGTGGVAEALAFINTASVLKILFSIVLSVVVAFIVGSLVQYFSRMLFTFDINAKIKRYGSIWGGFALAALTYFLMVKGAKGASFLSETQADWIKANALLLSAASWAFWTVVMQLLTWFTKVNIFKPVVLAGTFALAMAFAANDLVNFIGAPLAGLFAMQHVQGVENPLTQMMGALAEPVRANTWMLLIAGAIMAATLWMSKKARTVTATEVNLGRQGEGHERFESNAAARSIVRAVLAVIHFFSWITPAPVKAAVARRFDTTKYKPQPDANGEYPSFDYLRAAVNLIVSALLISFGTTLKLPLSTTYVTFMVAMATALPDRAWGRDSAVYRVAGVLTVIGGWFFTAIIASTAAAIIATIIYFTKLPGLLVLVGLAVALLFRSIHLHRSREKASEEAGRMMVVGDNKEEAFEMLKKEIGGIITRTAEILRGTNEGLITEDRTALKQMREDAKNLNKRGKQMVSSILRTSYLEEREDAIENKTYAEVMGSLRLLLRSVRDMTAQIYSHVSNNHKALEEEQIEDIRAIEKELHEQLRVVSNSLQAGDYSLLDVVERETQDVRDRIRKADKRQLKRSKKEKQTTRTSLLLLELLTEYEEIIFHSKTIYEGCSRMTQSPAQTKESSVR
ncbi:MAG TPA: inorganic phosphate transporter [Bacteroidota bacterium]|nr:inorganic phosphate transporter [Bacteroidota bacterium]